MIIIIAQLKILLTNQQTRQTITKKINTKIFT